MKAIQRHPYFTAWIAFCVILGVGGLWWTHHFRQRARQAAAALARDLRLHAQLSPPINLPGPANAPPEAEPPAGEIAPATRPLPRRPLDALIEIAGARAELRRLAARHEVALLPDESFGFASYAHAGPPTEQIAAVHRQLGLVQLALEKLFSARPGHLLAVRRESLHATLRDGPLEAAGDVFSLDPRLDPRVVGLIEGPAILLEFSGQTRVLRDFLQALATATEPLMVCSVEAEPLPRGTKFAVALALTQPTGPVESGGRIARQPAPIPLTPSDSLAAGQGRGYALFDRPDAERRAPLAAVKTMPAIGLELLEVKRELYRLQLMGYYGASGDYTATFVRPGSPEILRARQGHHFESLGLTVQSIELKKIRTEAPVGRDGFEIVASARLWDERSQETVTLVGREPLLTDNPLAVFRLGSSPAPAREFRLGDSFQDGAATYRVERIQLEPAEVVLVRQLPGDALPERQVLRPTLDLTRQAPADLVAAERRR